MVAQFYGHTHKDEYKIFYDEVQTDRPVNIAFIAPSLTTYSNLNPGVRVYTVDGDRPNATWVNLSSRLGNVLVPLVLTLVTFRLFWISPLGS